MISELIIIGNYARIFGSYLISNKELIATSYKVIDIARFSFYAMNKVGFIDLIKNGFAKKYIIFVDCKTEETELGDFELITFEE